MARLTITLSDDVHRQLRVRAATSGDTIGRLIERALEDQRELARARLMALMEKAWAHQAPEAARLSEDELMALAVEETHAVREEMARERKRSRA
jgi:hypothetical protein